MDIGLFYCKCEKKTGVGTSFGVRLVWDSRNTGFTVARCTKFISLIFVKILYIILLNVECVFSQLDVQFSLVASTKRI